MYSSASDARVCPRQILAIMMPSRLASGSGAASRATSFATFRPPYRMITATELTMASAAMTVRAVTPSPANAQPRNTATTGLT